MASATPHNGKEASFANLIRLLDPTAVSGDGKLDLARVRQLTIRRHRHSPEVAEEVGADWAERAEPDNRLVAASPAEDALADELVTTWLYPADGASPYSGTGTTLFPWTLAKAFLSSPAALGETIANRLTGLGDGASARAEAAALQRLNQLNEACATSSAKYDELLRYLGEIGVGPGSDRRAVVFSERVATLGWLRDRLAGDLKLRAGQVEVLHGGLADDAQQAIVESFKQERSPIRLLITGDVASEGVNLHRQCHHLIHFDIPWSLIRIEQRNGRIDRYGQRNSPQLTALLLDLTNERFAGDIRVLARLISREHEAHLALGDAASLMGKYSVADEEAAIRQVLLGAQQLDDVVADPAAVEEDADDWLLQFLEAPPAATPYPQAAPTRQLYERPVDFLRDALREYYPSPEDRPSGRDQGGVAWREYPAQQLVEFIPPKDLRQRLEALPQSYLAERRVLERLRLVTEPGAARRILESALSDANDSSWPEAHFLGPLHPVLDWAADRSLSRLSRGEVFAVRGDVDAPTVLLNGTLLNRRGQVVASSWLAATFALTQPLMTVHGSAQEMFESVGLLAERDNPGPVQLPDRDLIGPAVDAGSRHLDATSRAASQDVERRVAEWVRRAETWQADAEALIQRDAVRQRRHLVAEQERLSREMSPDRQLVRPLLLVLPADTPEATDGR